jgi:hypothetical protein
VSSRDGSARRCTATKADGSACRAWAIRGSDPPRCAAHSGRVGAPPGNQNALKHGFYSRLAGPISGIDDVIGELENRITMMVEFLDSCEDREEMLRGLALFGQMVSRYGRLLRDKKALSGKAMDDVLDGLATAAENLAIQMGWSIFDE